MTGENTSVSTIIPLLLHFLFHNLILSRDPIKPPSQFRIGEIDSCAGKYRWDIYGGRGS